MLITAGAIKMMAASVGMQFFNNYANSQKNREIQAKQREFQKATAEHDFERARKAQAEAAKIALELEAEVHQERVEDIQKNYDSLLENFAHGFAISNWPLNVLPFVMKGESFGSLISGTAKSISMHCVFTPSNCTWFNECFYDDLDSRVEAEMNNNWNSQSTHPIVYYGGGWNRRENKHGISIPSLIDLDDIALLKNKLKNIPTMVITPFFDPYLHFKVQLWGMGKDSDMPFRIDIPNKEMGDNNRIFTFDYNKDSTPEFSENFYSTTTKEFVAYLVSLIGFVADKYFWSMYGVTPILPKTAAENNQYDNKLAKYNTELYRNLISSEKDNSFSPSDWVKYLRLLEATAEFSEQPIHQLIDDYFVKCCYLYSNSSFVDDCVHTCTNNASLIPFLREFLRLRPIYCNNELENWLQIVEDTDTNILFDDCICIDVAKPSIEFVMDFVESESKFYYKPYAFCFCILNNNVIVGEFCNEIYTPLICNEMHGRAYLLIHNRSEVAISETMEFYEYNILTKKIYDMNLRNQQGVADLRKRVGNILIKHGKKLVQEAKPVPQKSGKSPWGESTQAATTFEDVINKIVHDVDSGAIDTKYVEEDMSISIVLDWLDSLAITNENKLYLVKGFVKEHNCFIYCAILAIDDCLLLQKESCRCFICPKESEEMKEIFNDTNVYIIPFTD